MAIAQTYFLTFRYDKFCVIVIVRSSSLYSDVYYPVIQFNSILYFNVLTQQLQEPITESAQVDKYIYIVKKIIIIIEIKNQFN
jgi:small-conductance mechanosensitive channel